MDAVITNSPWAQLTEPKGAYGELIREKAKELLGGDFKKTGQILVGSDISSVLLHGCINIAKSEVAFLMPDQVAYTRGSQYGLGKILTYSIVKDYDGEMVQVEFDAFKHGRLSCIAFLSKENGEVTCYHMGVKVKGEYSKALRLSEVDLSRQGGESYREFMKGVVAYTEFSSEDIKRELGVRDVVPMGQYIRGLLGGKKKRGAKRYAGLVFDVSKHDKTAGQYSIRLANTDFSVNIPAYYIKPYWKKLIYGWKIFPFHFDGEYNLLLSSEQHMQLENFLETHILKKISKRDNQGKIEMLIEESKQPRKPHFLERNKYHVIYRSHRTFVAVVITPRELRRISKSGTHDVVISDVASYIVTKNGSKAYYYSAILNYLAYKAFQEGGVFERRQFTKPLIAILQANLEWRSEKWQLKVATLSEKLQKGASKCFEGFIEGRMQMRRCFERIGDCKKTSAFFADLITTTDKNVDPKRIRESLKFVCKLG